MKTQQEIREHNTKVIDKKSDGVGVFVVTLILLSGVMWMLYQVYSFALSQYGAYP